MSKLRHQSSAAPYSTNNRSISKYWIELPNNLHELDRISRLYNKRPSREELHSACYHCWCSCSTTTCVESRFLEFHFTLYCNSFKAFSSLATFLTGSTGILSRPNFPNNFSAYTRLYLAYHFVLLFLLTEELSTQVSNYEFKNQSDHTCIRKQVITQWWEWNPQISKPTRRGFNEGVKKLQLIPLLFHLPPHPPVTWTLIIWFYQLSWQCKLVTVKIFESWRFER